MGDALLDAANIEKVRGWDSVDIPLVVLRVLFPWW
jgi:hypothetical protein